MTDVKHDEQTVRCISPLLLRQDEILSWRVIRRPLAPWWRQAWFGGDSAPTKWRSVLPLSQKSGGTAGLFPLTAKTEIDFQMINCLRSFLYLSM